MAQKRPSVNPTSFATFGDLLRYLRERAELSQRELALQVGYHYSYLSRLEKNVRMPDPATLMARFVPALGLDGEPEWTARLLELARTAESHVPEAGEAVADESILRDFPLMPHALLGRDEEAGAVTQLLRGEARLVTLIGPPGVGKTRLAAHVAGQLAGDFAHGSLFVDLAPLQQADQVVPTLMQSLGIHEAGAGNELERLKGRLHEENLLLVIDNFEQVLEAAPLLNQVLGHARSVKILATSREALRISGEVEFHLKPFPVPETNAVEEAEKSPAVQIFVQRARDARTDFKLTAEIAPVIVEICRKMDGLPLAIELAAARINMLTPQAMLSQIDRRFEWLARGGRDTHNWRRTLSGAVEWSYNLLGDAEKILLRRLAVFSAGWDLPAAEAVCMDAQLPRAEIFQLLIQLTEKSLVVADETHAEPRWRLLETLRQFGRDRLEESGELDAVRARHLTRFADWAEDIVNTLDTGAPLDFHQHIEKDLNNLRAALTFAAQTKTGITDALRLTAAFSYICLEYSMLKEGEGWVLKMLPLASAPEHGRLRADILHRGANLVYLAHWHERIQLAYEMGKEAEQIARKLGDKNLLAGAIYHQYEILVDLQKYNEARPLMEEGIAICRETGYQTQLSGLLTALGIVLYQQGDFAGSLKHIEEALALSKRHNDLWGQGFALRTMGSNLRFSKKYREALSAFERSLELARIMGYRISEGIILANLSAIANVLEDYSASGKYAQQAFILFQTIGSDYQQAFPLRMMSYAAIQAGNLPYARELNLESLRRNHVMGDEHRIGVYGNLVALAEILLAEKQFEQAAQLVSIVEKYMTEEGRTFQEPDTLALARVKPVLEKKKIKAKSRGEENLEQVVTEILKQ